MTPDPAALTSRAPFSGDLGRPDWLALHVHDASAPIARRFAEATVAPYGADRDNVGLITSELVTNALRAARRLVEEGLAPAWNYPARPLRIGVLATERWVRLSITDPDPRPIDPLAPSENGWGLGIVDTLSVKRWTTYEAESKTVHVIVAAPGVALSATEVDTLQAATMNHSLRR
ncbi:ATP-binding protein [Actinoallomurus sp. NPDC052274]|uniref:ATP-binding protein n=1 Tax=Actinoallomurus sp. NPDC052274 TaxID=3155420 RepID=UPI0034197DC6